MNGDLIFFSGLIMLVFLQVLFVFTRFKKCPPNKLLVIFGKTGRPNDEPIIIDKGGAFVWPAIQDFAYLDLGMMNTQGKVPFKLQDGELIQIDGQFNYVISKDENKVKHAVTRLLAKERDEIQLIVMDLVNAVIKRRVGGYRTRVELAKEERGFRANLEKEAKEVLEKIGVELILFDVKF